MLAFCRPVIGKEWIAGKLYAHGTAPSLEEVYDFLEDQPRSSLRSEDNEQGVDEMHSPESHRDTHKSTRSKTRRISVTDLIFNKHSSNSNSDAVFRRCILNGLVLQWSHENSASDQFTRARWTLCTESEYKQKAAAKAAESLASASPGEGAAAATMVVEEIVQLQFFHPLFRKYDGACEYLQALLQCPSTCRSTSARSADSYNCCVIRVISDWRFVPSQNVPQLQVPAWSDSKGRKLGHWKSLPEQVHAEADRLLLPFEGNWVRASTFSCSIDHLSFCCSAIL